MTACTINDAVTLQGGEEGHTPPPLRDTSPVSRRSFKVCSHGRGYIGIIFAVGHTMDSETRR